MSKRPFLLTSDRHSEHEQSKRICADMGFQNIVQNHFDKDHAPGTSEGETIQKPRRALSAYNFFLREERQRIIALQQSSEDDDPGEHGDRAYASSAGISFQDMGKMIGARWNEVKADKDMLAKYKKLAKDDSERYAREMAQYNEKKKASILRTMAAKQEERKGATQHIESDRSVKVRMLDDFHEYCSSKSPANGVLPVADVNASVGKGVPVALPVSRPGQLGLPSGAVGNASVLNAPSLLSVRGGVASLPRQSLVAGVGVPTSSGITSVPALQAIYQPTTSDLLGGGVDAASLMGQPLSTSLQEAQLTALIKEKQREAYMEGIATASRSLLNHRNMLGFPSAARSATLNALYQAPSNHGVRIGEQSYLGSSHSLNDAILMDAVRRRYDDLTASKSLQRKSDINKP